MSSCDVCDYKDWSDLQTPRPPIMKGMRQPKSSKFLSESEFFMMTDAADAINTPTFDEHSTVVDVEL